MFGAVGAGFVRVNLESVWKKRKPPRDGEAFGLCCGRVCPRDNA